MRRIDWPRLIRLGLVELRLRPDDFWTLTPGELLLLAGHGEDNVPPTRAGIAELLARFPDTQGGKAPEGHDGGL